MTEREFMAVCALGHRGYVRLRGIVGDDWKPWKGKCSKCGQPTLLHHELEPPR